MLPTGWLASGMAPEDYEMGLDTSQHHSGTRSGFIRSIKQPPRDFGMLSQYFVPDDFRAHRVCLSAWIRTKDVESWCGLWMRIDGAEKRALAFDNMHRRGIRGTTDWTRYEVVLDVAPEATVLAFGILLVGNGAAWLDDVAFEIVGKDVPTTGDPEAPHQPRNLNFED